MMKFKTEEEMQKDLAERIAKWKEGFSKDGYVEKADGEFEYKGIKYLIKILRYYNHTDKFTSMSSRVSDSHCVVEYPDELKDLVDAVKDVEEYSEFLWHDTLHSYNDNMTIEEQINECHRLAKQDIDDLPNKVKLIKEKAERVEKVISTFII